MSQLSFGVNIPTTVGPGVDPVGRARAAEDLGFDFVSASDHPCGTNPSYETWTMLTWVAARTSRVKVATRVLGLPYRPPPMVAKMAETLDRLSGGRLVLGLGAGYSDSELAAFGLGVPSPAEKITGLKEALSIIRGLWSEQQFSFAGRRYRTEAADIEPKPGHQIPIWLGTFGERALDLTGQVADGWVPSLGYAPPDALPAMRARVLAAAEAAGRDPEMLTCALNVEVHVGAEVDPQPDVIAGSPEQVAARLAGFVAAGFSAFNFLPLGSSVPGQIERIATEVVPALRELG
jgi:alkanesulfonate monooxygenase SsuD/methylene tetrahydromethanopterin reductase-like flavin-dependent oxidoreductase (luciferase family)